MTARAFELEHLVTFEETNVVGNVYFVNHLRWQGECRERFLHQYAPAVLEALGRGLALVTTRCACEYFAELVAFDRVTVRMRLAELHQHRFSMTFDYLRDGDERQLVARGEQEVACMRRCPRGLAPTPLPPELTHALQPFMPPTGGPALAGNR